MTEIICSVIAAAATIICAYLAHSNEKRGKREDARAEQRAKEGRLQLQMLAANTNLTIGVATALKNGHANGEVEKGLEEVSTAQKAYRKFLEELAIDQVRT